MSHVTDELMLNQYKMTLVVLKLNWGHMKKAVCVYKRERSLGERLEAVKTYICNRCMVMKFVPHELWPLLPVS